MPPSTDEKILGLIVAALQRGESRSQISTAYQVSPRNITRISTNLKIHGSPRAPPSGLKQGRPIKMTKEQADAMLAWMAGRDYTFYVKHLTGFLHENYGFEGCDGTIRRAIIRAGFSRKLPWHKSQCTSWIPPNGPPDLSFVYNSNASSSSARSRAKKAASAAVAVAAAVTVQDHGAADSCDTMTVADSGRSSSTGDCGIDAALQAAEATALLSGGETHETAAAEQQLVEQQVAYPQALPSLAPALTSRIPLDPQLACLPPPANPGHPLAQESMNAQMHDWDILSATGEQDTNREQGAVSHAEMMALRRQVEHQREELERLRNQVARQLSTRPGVDRAESNPKLESGGIEQERSCNAFDDAMQETQDDDYDDGDEAI